MIEDIVGCRGRVLVPGRYTARSRAWSVEAGFEPLAADERRRPYRITATGLRILRARLTTLRQLPRLDSNGWRLYESKHGIVARYHGKTPELISTDAMSSAELTLVHVHIALYGAVREADEETTAHIWQLLMAANLPLLLFFAVKWLPRAPSPALYVMTLQACTAVASLALVFIFNL